MVYVNVTCKFTKIAQKNFNEAERQFGELINGATSEELDLILEGLNMLKKLVNKQVN